MAAHKGQKKVGGRQKGTPNKATAKREAAIAKSGKTPLQFLIDRMRNSKAPMAERIDCARAAAPYVHPRAAVTVNLDAKLNITEVRDVIVDPREQDHVPVVDRIVLPTVMAATDVDLENGIERNDHAKL